MRRCWRRTRCEQFRSRAISTVRSRSVRCSSAGLRAVTSLMSEYFERQLAAIESVGNGCGCQRLFALIWPTSPNAVSGECTSRRLRVQVNVLSPTKSCGGVGLPPEPSRSEVSSVTLQASTPPDRRAAMDFAADGRIPCSTPAGYWCAQEIAERLRSRPCQPPLARLASGS